MKEVWKEIKGFRENYLISNSGKIKTVARHSPRSGLIESHSLTPAKTRNGYLRVSVSDSEGKRKSYYVHRLVAMLFIPKPEGKDFINHIDGNKQNNSSDNLEWVTRSENERHAWRIGLKNKNNQGVRGEKHGMHKLTQAQVDYIRGMHRPFDDEYGSVALGRRFGVSDQTITDIVHYRTWKDPQLAKI